MARAQLWYTRCGTQVRGPFHAGLIRRYLVLGRLSEADEVSVDQQTWTRISLVPQLAVEALPAAGDDPMARERLLAAKRWADERWGYERRALDGREGGGPEDPSERRTAEPRRAPESAPVLHHRAGRTGRAASPAAPSCHPLGLFLVLVIGVVFVGLFFTLKPPAPAKGPDCTSAPAPRVNWANCYLEGRRLGAANLRGANLHNANLSGADLSGSNLAQTDLAFAKLRAGDLRHADLSNARLKGANLSEANLQGADLRRADLSYAILRGASLAGARLDGANLVNAIWVDGAVCGRGSLGGCRLR